MSRRSQNRSSAICSTRGWTAGSGSAPRREHREAPGARARADGSGTAKLRRPARPPPRGPGPPGAAMRPAAGVRWAFLRQRPRRRRVPPDRRRAAVRFRDCRSPRPARAPSCVAPAQPDAPQRRGPSPLPPSEPARIRTLPPPSQAERLPAPRWGRSPVPVARGVPRAASARRVTAGSRELPCRVSGARGRHRRQNEPVRARRASPRQQPGTRTTEARGRRRPSRLSRALASAPLDVPPASGRSASRPRQSPDSLHCCNPRTRERYGSSY